MADTSPPTARQRDESGQAIVIFAGGLIAILAVLALVIDTGNVWANQRMVQNGSDAAAEAGAIVLAERLAGVRRPREAGTLLSTRRSPRCSTRTG